MESQAQGNEGEGIPTGVSSIELHVPAPDQSHHSITPNKCHLPQINVMQSSENPSSVAGSTENVQFDWEKGREVFNSQQNSLRDQEAMKVPVLPTDSSQANFIVPMPVPVPNAQVEIESIKKKLSEEEVLPNLVLGTDNDLARTNKHAVLYNESEKSAPDGVSPQVPIELLSITSKDVLSPSPTDSLSNTSDNLMSKSFSSRHVGPNNGQNSKSNESNLSTDSSSAQGDFPLISFASKVKAGATFFSQLGQLDTINTTGGNNEDYNDERVTKLRKEAAILEGVSSATVWFRKSFKINNDAYLDAVGEVVGNASIMAINTDDKNRLEIILTDILKADALVRKGIVIAGDWFKAYRIAEKPLKVSLAKVPPFIPHSTIVEALSPYGICTASDVENIHAFTRKASQKHILTFRRSVWIRVEPDSPKLPSYLVVYFAGKAYTIDIMDNTVKCFLCGNIGHMRARCPTGSPNFEPLVTKTGRGYQIVKSDTYKSLPTDVQSWGASYTEPSVTPDISQDKEDDWVIVSRKKKQPIAGAGSTASTDKGKDVFRRDSINKFDLQSRVTSMPTLIRSASDGSLHRSDKLRLFPYNEDCKNLKIISKSNTSLLKSRGKGKNKSVSIPPSKPQLPFPTHMAKGVDHSVVIPIATIEAVDTSQEKVDSSLEDNPDSPFFGYPVSKKERSKMLKLADCFCEAKALEVRNWEPGDDPLAGMSASDALSIFSRNQPWFEKQIHLAGLGQFLDKVTKNYLMDSEGGPIKAYLKRGAPSFDSSTDESVSMEVNNINRSCKRVNMDEVNENVNDLQSQFESKSNIINTISIVD